jgi:hypothetical protein
MTEITYDNMGQIYQNNYIESLEENEIVFHFLLTEARKGINYFYRHGDKQ